MVVVNELGVIDKKKYKQVSIRSMAGQVSLMFALQKAGAITLLGVSIGKNCVICAGGVVTKNIPDNSMAVGSPPSVIEKLN